VTFLRYVIEYERQVVPRQQRGGFPHDLGGWIAVDLLRLGVGVGDEAVGIDREHRVRGAVEDCAERVDRVMELQLEIRLLRDGAHDGSRGFVCSVDPKPTDLDRNPLARRSEQIEAFTREATAVEESPPDRVERLLARQPVLQRLSDPFRRAAAESIEVVGNPTDTPLGVDHEQVAVGSVQAVEQSGVPLGGLRKLGHSVYRAHTPSVATNTNLARRRPRRPRWLTPQSFTRRSGPSGILPKRLDRGQSEFTGETRIPPRATTNGAVCRCSIASMAITDPPNPLVKPQAVSLGVRFARRRVSRHGEG
jgi:hypothetical protein